MTSEHADRDQRKSCAAEYERLQLLFQCAPIAVVLLDEDKTVVDVNHAALDLFGVKEEDVLGKPCASFCDLPENQSCPLDGSETFSAEMTVFQPGGATIPVLKNARRITLHGKSYYYETFVDIASQKNAETEKVRLEKQLLQSQKMDAMGALAAGIAHEINTPVQFISDNTKFLSDAMENMLILIAQYREVLKSYVPADVYEECAATCGAHEAAADMEYLKKEIPLAIAQTKEGLQRVTKIVGAMKDFAHRDMEAKVRADINDSVEKAAMITKNEWKYTADLKLDLDPSLPQILCYISDINQVLINLVVNASHAIVDATKSTKGKGLITIRTARSEDMIAIDVSDTGVGIPERARERIFEHFYTTKPVGKGTGQGLSMAYKAIVDRHKGKIYFDTEVGTGTTFHVRIPIL